MPKREMNYNFIDPMILKILGNSNVPMAALAINYMVNQSFGKEVNLRIIKKHLAFLVLDEKISKNSANLHSVPYYKLVE